MNTMIPIVMGMTVLAYMHSFNTTMKLYKNSGYTLTFQELILIRYNEMMSVGKLLI
jgi:SNF family Na+-dependent transporter